MRPGRLTARTTSRSLNQWPLLVVIAGAVVGIVLVALSHWRMGNGLIGMSLCLGAVERVVLPRRMVGLLQVRSKLFDAAVLATMGVAIMVLAAWIDALN